MLESPEADEAASECEERFVDLGAAVVADEESFELVEPGEGSFDDPPVAAKSGAVCRLTSGYLGFDAARLECSAVDGEVVGAVGADAVGSATGPADLPTNRWHPVNKRDQLGAVVTVPTGDGPREREPAAVYQEVVFRAVSGSINWARARFGAPFFA